HFFVVSRFEDVERGLVDRKNFSSSRGVTLGMIEVPDVEIPPGLFIAEDAPFHTMHRGVVSRVFTPKAMEALQPLLRAFTAHTLDALVGSGGFDFVRDVGMIIPMQVISMLVGIPEKDQGKLRQMSEDALQRAYDPEQAPFAAMGAINMVFEEYIAW